jgi:hypothetical protein
MFKSTSTFFTALPTKAFKHTHSLTSAFGLVTAMTLGVFASANPAYATPTIFTKPIVTVTTPWNLALDVSGASQSDGAKVILWWGTGRNNQQWTFEQTGKVDGSNNVYRIRNVNSGKCLTTNGIAGSQLYQYTCIADYPYQEWSTSLGQGFSASIKNPTFGLYVDVLGSKFAPGASVGVWYKVNWAINQVFF